MDKQEAIKAIKSNWPDSRYTILREALDMAVEALRPDSPIVGNDEEILDIRQWNFQTGHGSIVEVCRDEHDKGAACEYETMSAEEIIQIIEQLRGTTLSHARRSPPTDGGLRKALDALSIGLSLFEKINPGFDAIKALKNLALKALQSAELVSQDGEWLRKDMPPMAEQEQFDARLSLALNHGCSGIYGDDGEIQCNNMNRHDLLDFKRQTYSELSEALIMMRLKELSERQTAEPVSQIGKWKALEDILNCLLENVEDPDTVAIGMCRDALQSTKPPLTDSEQLQEKWIDLTSDFEGLTSTGEIKICHFKDGDFLDGLNMIRDIVKIRPLTLLSTEPFYADFDAFCNAVNKWQDETFPSATPDSVFAHMESEMIELDEDRSPGEAADMQLLLIGFANKSKFNLYEVTKKKFEVNKKRKWGKPNAKGFAEHIQDNESSAEDTTESDSPDTALMWIDRGFGYKS
jgi:hypothetical protein